MTAASQQSIKSKKELNVRLNQDQLKDITSRAMPSAQVRWFVRHYGRELPHDRKGVILTAQAWEAMVAEKCGTSAVKGPQNAMKERPAVKLKGAAK